MKRETSSISRKKMSLSHVGLKHTEETKHKIGAYHKGDRSHFWKGGVDNKNLPLFDTYSDKLSFAVDVRRSKSDNSLLEVRCHFCGVWFIPKRHSVIDRIRALEGKIKGECNLYCSDICKGHCSTYKKSSNVAYDNPRTTFYSSWPYKVWREEVMNRAGSICEYCGEKATDAHHIIPRSICKLFELDPDYGVACCESCHYKYGHAGKCSIKNLTK